MSVLQGAVDMEAGYPYYIQVILLGKVSQLVSFVEKGTGIEHDEDQLGSYWSPPGMEGGAWIIKGSCQR